jgi:transcriptional regulator with PAS, ATPase and Fis domain
MKYPKKYDPTNDLPGDVKKLVQQIAKRFRSPGLNVVLLKEYMHQQIYKAALDSADQDISKAAKNLGVEYITLWMHVKRSREKFEKDFNVGKTQHN